MGLVSTADADVDCVLRDDVHAAAPTTGSPKLTPRRTSAAGTPPMKTTFIIYNEKGTPTRLGRMQMQTTTRSDFGCLWGGGGCAPWRAAAPGPRDQLMRASAESGMR